MTEDYNERMKALESLGATVAMETSIDFHDTGGEEIIRFCENGEMFIRGEKVDDNKSVYEALKTFLMSGDKFQAGYAAALTDQSETVQMLGDLVKDLEKSRDEARALADSYRIALSRIVAVRNDGINQTDVAFAMHTIAKRAVGADHAENEG